MSRRLVVLSGGVGGARLARGFEQLSEFDTTVVVNVGDDDLFYGQHVSPDVDTVLYTLAGLEGAEGWGRHGDTRTVMDHLTALGVDTTFMVGDADLALNLYRTNRLRGGATLAAVTAHVATTFGIRSTILPVTNDRVRTHVKIADDDQSWLPFQEYFVLRGHRDEVLDVRFDDAKSAEPAPGVISAIREADAVVVAPSNPPLSVWPILAVPKVADAVAQAKRVVAVSPLFGGRALKGPADRVLRSLGFSSGNAGIIEAYEGLLDDLIIDVQDGAERSALTSDGVAVHVASTRIADPEDAAGFARWFAELL